MIQDSNLFEEVSAYFAPISSYELAINEQIELLWMPHVENPPIHKERFSDTKRALARAAALAPRYTVCVLAKSRQGDSIGMTEEIRPLVVWSAHGCGSIGARIDGFVEFESRSDGCAGAEFRYYPGPGCTYYAFRCYYPERGCEPSPSITCERTGR